MSRLKATLRARSCSTAESSPSAAATACHRRRSSSRRPADCACQMWNSGGLGRPSGSAATPSIGTCMEIQAGSTYRGASFTRATTVAWRCTARMACGLSATWHTVWTATRFSWRTALKLATSLTATSALARAARLPSLHRTPRPPPSGLPTPTTPSPAMSLLAPSAATASGSASRRRRLSTTEPRWHARAGLRSLRLKTTQRTPTASTGCASTQSTRRRRSHAAAGTRSSLRCSAASPGTRTAPWAWLPLRWASWCSTTSRSPTMAAAPAHMSRLAACSAATLSSPAWLMTGRARARSCR
mmetsp:Transcript_11977/g.35319  ORF Transcript_11977/g.35319 Transcript_11977/m.35319 type:complete len:300 (-) Transcript_11977:2376-3275(-)